MKVGDLVKYKEPINEKEESFENRSKHSAETSNSSGTNATSHLSGFVAVNESPGGTTFEEDPINAAAAR